MASLKLNEFFDAVAERLRSDAMNTTLGGAGRVYSMSVQPPAAEGGPQDYWGRVLLLPRSTLWPQKEVPGEARHVAWLVTVELNDFRANGFNPDVSINAAHDEAKRLLDNWKPQVDHVQMAMPIWRHGAPPNAALYDSVRKLWISAAEYRAMVVPS